VDSLESKDTAMVETALVPGCVGGPMTRFTGRRESRGYVVRVLDLLVFGAVAAIAFPGSAFVDVVLVAGAAVLRRVDAPEEERHCRG